MALTATDWQARLLQEVGAGLEGSDELDILTPALPSIWDAWAGKAAVAPYLQYLYAKRHALDVLQGQLRNRVNFSVGPLSVSLSQNVANLQTLRNNVTAEIEAVEKRAQAGRPAALGYLTRTAPLMPDPLVPGQLDPNARVYRGDPLERPDPLDAAAGQ